MRIITTQEQTFADSFINIPNSKLDMINKLINGHIIAKKLTNIKTDYSIVSLFKALLIGTWHHLSDKRLADSLSRDLVFINFCEFSISGNKPDATTHPANDSDMTHFEENIKQANNHKGVRVLYDKGASSQANSEVLKAQKPKGKTMSHWSKLRNKAISNRRFVVERTFGTLKRTDGLASARYIGLEKVASEVNLKAIAYHLTRAATVYIRKELMTT